MPVRFHKAHNTNGYPYFITKQVENKPKSHQQESWWRWVKKKSDSIKIIVLKVWDNQIFVFGEGIKKITVSVTGLVYLPAIISYFE